MKVGDKYICITDRYVDLIKKGGIYTVSRVDADGHFLFSIEKTKSFLWTKNELDEHIVPDSPLARAVYCSEESAND